MPLWSCEWDDCGKPAVRIAGDCLLCDRHLCRTHLQEPWHKCPKAETNWEAYSAQYAATEARDIDELCRRIDGSKLCSIASASRGGAPCTVELSRKSLSAMMGGQNCHAEIAFQDNVKWLARFRLARTSSPPQQVRDRILRSEVATMRYLRKHTRIPVPEIFDWACESDPGNQIGTGYILMEKLGGQPLNWRKATSAQREKVMQQLVDISLELEKHPFEAIGSLVPTDDADGFEVQELAHHATFRGGGASLGPFSSSLEGSRAMLELYLEMAAGGEIDSHDPVDVYLTHRFRLDVVDALWEEAPTERRFFLKHPDDKGDHIMVNESFDIVGVIDWEWAHTVSKAEAFSSPCMMWPVAKFYDGSNELDACELRLADIFRERGREDLARCVTEGRKVQRFFFDLGPASPFSDRSSFTNLFIGLRRAFGTGIEEGWEQWKSAALEKWKEDWFLQLALPRSSPDPELAAVARERPEVSDGVSIRSRVSD